MKTHFFLFAAISLLLAQASDGNDEKPEFVRIAGKYYCTDSKHPKDSVELRANGTFSIYSELQTQIGNSCCKNGTYNILADGQLFLTPEDGFLMNFRLKGTELYGESQVFRKR